MVRCECDRSRWKCSLCKCSLISFATFCAYEGISCLNYLLKITHVKMMNEMMMMIMVMKQCTWINL